MPGTIISTLRIISVVGARPNFIKVAPLHKMFQNFPGIDSKIVHTGQHYDQRMSDVFFKQLEMPDPHYFLGIGSGSSTTQMAKTMLAFETVLKTEKPELVLVVGDVNSTVACALTAARENIPVLHVEAGLRSGDRSMPEEVNRIMTDHISEQLFVTENAGRTNLLNENISADRIHHVGNVMIDSLIQHREKAFELPLSRELGLVSGSFVLLTMHRPFNVDSREALQKIIEIVTQISSRIRIVFPLHPRTSAKLAEFGLLETLKSIKDLILLPPQGYLEFLHLTMHSALVMTDSGGVQEETTFLNIPCVTLRPNTERPVTIEKGTNYLMKEMNITSICDLVDQILDGELKSSKIPELWDGNASQRIADVILKKYGI